MIFLLACAERPPEPVEEHGTLIERGVKRCSDPDARTTLGPMERTNLGPDWELHQPADWAGDDYYYGEALAVADLTGDDRVDVLVADRSRLLFYASTPDGSWEEESNDRFPSLADEDGHWGMATVAAVDLDGDDDLDLFLGRVPYANAVFLNDGTGHFTDLTADSGISPTSLRVRSTPFGDLDGDGDLDLFIGNDHSGQDPPDPGDANALYENLGDGTFRDISDRLSADARDGYTRVAGWYDVNQDGAQDLYIVNHMPIYTVNHLLLNDGAGQLVPAPDAGADVFISGMGLGVADLNADLLPDFLVAGWGDFALLESVGDTLWADTALARGMVHDPDTAREVAWGTDFADFDNDGRVDVVSVYGPASQDDGGTVEANPPDEPDGLWLQQADGTFTQVADEWGVADTGNGRAVAAADLDDDGWIDLVTQGKSEAPVAYLARCGDAAWLRVRLHGRGPNTRGIGARVSVTGGGHTETRWVSAMGSSAETSLPPEVHVGLGEAETARIEVLWPDGEESVFESVTTRQTVTIEE